MILLDTHVLVWLVTDPRKLSRTATRVIERAYSKGEVGISDIALWELATLFSSGRLRGRGTVEASVKRIATESRVVIHAIDSTIAALAVHFPEPLSKDPADRLIVATAVSLGLPLVSKDASIQDHAPCEVVW